MAALLGSSVGCADDAASVKSCLDEPGVICTWAGTGKHGFNLDGKLAHESNLYWPIDVTIDAELGTYILDWNNHRVREVKKDGTLQTVIGTDTVGDGPDDLSDLMAPGAPGTDVTLNHPTALLPMPDGTLTLAAWHNHKLRSFDPETGLVAVTCGGAAGFAGDGGLAKQAMLNNPSQMVVAENGSVYIVDQRNQVIRRIDESGVISTFAGTPEIPGFDGDGGPALEARLNFPTGTNPPPGGGLALDGEGYLYVSDTLNHRIRRIDLDSNTITTIAGTGDAGFSGDDGKAISAKLNFPRKLTLGPDGRLYVGDQKNHRIRAIDLKRFEITTVAGNGKSGFTEDGVLPTETSLHEPAGVSFDEEGAMYIIDSLSSRIRRVLPEVSP